MKRNIIQLLLGVALLLGANSHASAASIWLRDTPNPTDHFANINGNSLKRSGVGTIDGGNYWAGMLDFEANTNGGTANTPGWFNLLTYCIDPFRSLAVGPANGNGGEFTLRSLTDYFTTYTPSIGNASMVALTVDRIQKLWAVGFEDSKANATKAAAFQFLLWEYIADGGSIDLGNTSSSGIIRISNTDVRNAAIGYNNLVSNTTLSTTLFAVHGASKQSFLIPEPRIPTNDNVPEPGTYALIGAGLLAVGLARRKK